MITRSPPGRHPTRPAAPRAGFMTWILLLCFGVASVLATNLLQRSQVSFRRSHHILDSRLALQLASSAADAAIARFGQALGTGQGALHDRLTADGAFDELVGDLDVGDSLPALEADLALLRASVQGGRGVDLDVELTLDRIEPLVDEAEADLGRDGREKTGQLTVTARARIGKTPRSVVLQRPFKIVNLVAPVTSRFTLFVKDPAANTPGADGEDPGNGGYNRFRNTIDGSPIAGGDSVLPLSFLHHGEETASVLPFDDARPGWVYLGGDRQIVLNITSGHDVRHGEGFLFHSLQESGSVAERSRLDYLVDPQGAGAPELFRTTYSHKHWKTGLVSMVDFKLKRRRLGFFERDNATPAGDVDSGLLGIDPATYNVRSSVLHLFGTGSSPSPTRVFGNVSRSFPEYAGVVVDVDQDGSPDASLKPLLASDGAEAGDELPASFELKSDGRKYLLEDLTLADGRPASFEGPDERAFTCATIFSGELDYETARSQVVVEPYLLGLDTLVSEKTEVPAPQSEALAGEAYPLDPAAVSILREGAANAQYFDGDLDSVDNRAVERRLAFRFDSLEDFAQWSMQDLSGGTLRLDAPVSVDGAVDLQGIRTVSEGGILAARTLVVGGLDRQGTTPVSLVALAGDITCHFTSRVEASLVALAGAVLGGPEAREVDLVGNLVARTLAPDAFPAGGTVRYDTDLDPAGAGPEGYSTAYRTFVADASSCWRIAR